MEVHNRNWLKSVWGQWFELELEKDKLERALTFLAQFQCGLPLKTSLKQLLDQLAEEFTSMNIKKDSYGLAYFLFEIKRLKGAKTDYDNPQNSNLIYVIRERRGIPISLVCVYMLVASRLGLVVEGCNFPGHFLARIEFNGQKVLVDCFRGGKILGEKDLAELHSGSPSFLDEGLQEGASVETIIARVLGNLIRAYDRAGNFADSQLMAELLSGLESIQVRMKTHH